MKIFRSIAITALLASLMIPASALGTTYYAGVDFDVEAPSDEQDVMYEGLTVDGVDIGGMTLAQARSALLSAQNQVLSQQVTMTLDDQTLTMSWRELGAGYASCDGILDGAMKLGKYHGGLIARFMALKDIECEGLVYETERTLDETILKAAVAAKFEGMDGTAQNATITRENGQFIVTPDVTGVVVDIDGTVDEIKALYESSGFAAAQITAAAKVDKAPITAEMLEAIQDQLGKCTTHVGGTDNRAFNVAHGASKINGLLLMPGESASASDLMGPREPYNGYRVAPQYVDGTSVDAVGGGVCQVSSTLYNALLGAELQIDERHSHSMKVTYLDPSKDAAIAMGVKDLKFTNNLEYPVYIEGWSKDRNCTFIVWGKETRPAGREVTYKSVVTYEGSIAEVTKYDPTQPAGAKKTASGHPEVRSRLEKIVKENGVEVSRETISTDYYMHSAKVITIGTGGLTPQEYEASLNTTAAPTPTPTPAPVEPPAEPEPTQPEPSAEPEPQQPDNPEGGGGETP